MSKRDLRVSMIPLTAGKISYKKELENVGNLQPFFPPIEVLFKTNKLENMKEYGIKLSNPIIPEVHHSKITMLLSPFKWMRGEFGNLCMPSEQAEKYHSKLQSPNNAAYVGSVLSVVLSESGCQHFPLVYGAFTGTARTHVVDISDDYEELSERSWFSNNIGKTFQLKLDEHLGSTIQYTRNARSELVFGDDASLGDVNELEGIPTEETEAAVLTQIFKDEEEDEESDSSSVSTSYIFDIESMNSSFDGSVGEEEDESFAWATFENVPVQMTIMEKLEGTLYELLKENPEPEKHFAWLGQIVFALAYAQRNFAFTHNDLHANNVMYKETSEEFFYYIFAGTSYKIPTYGYLLKIIDFDRGIGSIKLPQMKEAKTFMSDQFSIDEEAGGQYNTQPFYTNKHAIIKPNASFDLVRLATSLFWDLFPEGQECSEYHENPVFKLFIKWMTLEDKTSVLFFKNNEKVDRFIGFSLYKAIARYSKNAVPHKEISEFSKFVGFIPSMKNPLVIEV